MREKRDMFYVLCLLSVEMKWQIESDKMLKLEMLFPFFLFLFSCYLLFLKREEIEEKKISEHGKKWRKKLDNLYDTGARIAKLCGDDDSLGTSASPCTNGSLNQKLECKYELVSRKCLKGRESYIEAIERTNACAIWIFILLGFLDKLGRGESAGNRKRERKRGNPSKT